MPLNIGVLVSGRGSNLEAVLRAAARGRLKGARVAVTISNRKDARALSISRRYGVPAVHVPDAGAAPEAYGRKLAKVLSHHGVLPGKGLVLLAGFMKILPASFVSLYRGRMMNIHPSLLPAFPGLDAQKQAIDYGVKMAGCTVHFVVPEVDAGPVILQRAVEVKEKDDVESLSARILRQEHLAYVRAVELFAAGRLRIDGRRVVVG